MEDIEFANAVKDVDKEYVLVLTEKNADVIRAFHPLPGNRAIKKERIDQIAASMIKGEFIPPIIVSLPSRQITEGNHRYQAALRCLELGTPFTLRVYMYKDTDALSTARVINNTQKRWTANDRLKSYVYEGRKSYLLLKDFMDQFPDLFKKGKGSSEYRIIPALCLLGNGRSSNSMENTFYTGKLVINDQHVKAANQYVSELIAISEILKDKTCFERYSSLGWIRARTRLGMSVPQFLTVLKRKAKNWQPPKSTAKAWFDMYISMAGGF